MTMCEDSRDVRGGPPQARPIPSAEPVSPLNEADYQAIRRAAVAHRPVRNAARIAMTSAFTILVVAALAVPFVVLSPGIANLVIAAGLGIIGYLEYAGARKMRRGLPEAASHLGWNQVVFIALICVYCLVRMFDVSADSYISPEDRNQLSQVPELTSIFENTIPSMVRAFYLLVMLLSIILQGGLAWYYFTRRRHLEALQRSTPAWIRRLFEEVNRG